MWWLLSCLSEPATEPPPEPEPGLVVVLGFDGVDPDLVMRWRSELPNLAAHIDAGHFHRLGTTTPPQSPVAWSSFATGLPPGQHGILDFVKREGLSPEVATNRYHPARMEADGLVGARGTSPRAGTPFWKTASDAGVPVTALWVPYSFPPDDLGADGRMVSGLGTPDLELTNSTSFLLTSKRADERVAGSSLVPLQREGDDYAARINGPTVVGLGTPWIRVGATVERQTRSVRLVVGQQELVVAEGSWSSWLHLEFPLSEQTSAHALVRIHVVEAFNDLELYVTPLMIDPTEPWLRFTTPDDYGSELMARWGPFETVGWVHDTSALQAGLIEEALFLDNVEQTFQRRARVALGELERQDEGLFVAVFTATDRVSHMTWGEDLRHVEASYRWMDELLGEVEARLDADDVLVVLSDHGFHAYTHQLHVNALLREGGHLVLKEGGSGSLLGGDIDWERTKAWSMGTGQVFLVDENPALASQIAEELRSYEVDGQRPLREVLVDPWPEGPELRLVFEPGWQASRATTLGGVPPATWEPNTRPWSGDHAGSPAEETEGMLLMEGVVQAPLHILDVPPTLLFMLGVEVPTDYTGTVVTRSAGAP
ncbi:MAG TPA: alkaline phosphatase family protein [Myxococcota bacterium]|nr:alkaline phosphatase family protein [Myxococcota bacterium]